MDNALKYSPAGGEICVMSGRRGTDVFVSVRDQGIGISAEHLPRMFTRFGRLPTQENMSISGTGLGLFLCKEIAVRHGGDIKVNSRPGVLDEQEFPPPLAAGFLSLRLALFHICMIVRRFGVGGRCLGVGADKRTALPRRQVATMAGLVGLEGLAVRTETMLKCIEQMVVGPGKAGEGNQRYACGGKEKRVLFHVWTPF